MLSREAKLEIELRHLVGTLNILLDLLKRDDYLNTVIQVQKTVDNAVKLLGEEK